MYMVFGGSASLRAGKDDLVTSSDRLEIRRMNAKIEFGIGLERYFEFFSSLSRATLAENIKGFATIGALESAHIFDHTKDRYFDFAKHADCLDRIKQSHFLRGADDDGTSQRQCL